MSSDDQSKLCRMPNDTYIRPLHVSAIAVDYFHGGDTLHAMTASHHVQDVADQYAVYAALISGTRLQLTESYQSRAHAQVACDLITGKYFLGLSDSEGPSIDEEPSVDEGCLQNWLFRHC